MRQNIPFTKTSGSLLGSPHQAQTIAAAFTSRNGANIKSSSRYQGAKPVLMSNCESLLDWEHLSCFQTRHAAANVVTKVRGTLHQSNALTMGTSCRTYASYADDLEQLAGSLGVQQFYVIGVSGGGPYTYAAAAYLPDRVLGLMTISTLAQAGDRQTLTCLVRIALCLCQS